MYNNIKMNMYVLFCGDYCFNKFKNIFVSSRLHLKGSKNTDVKEKYPTVSLLRKPVSKVQYQYSTLKGIKMIKNDDK